MASIALDTIASRITGLSTEQEFNALALEIFSYQSEHNAVYRRFLTELGRPAPQRWQDIPCLPISAFKHHRVQTGSGEAQIQFVSSGTTGQQRSRHHVRDAALYEASYLQHFEQRYGPVQDCCILGLLPSYLEQGESSLVYMVEGLIEHSGHPLGGTYLYDHARLAAVLEELQAQNTRSILIGVSYALLDFVAERSLDLPQLIVMETGGMKGRKKEMLRAELHRHLKRGFGVEAIHSEYGMTELLSQAYSSGGGLFYGPPWMRTQVRDITDPFQPKKNGKTGGLNVYDLANVHSCSFIATDDLARQYADGSYEVLGRYDQSDVRGCSLMV